MSCDNCFSSIREAAAQLQSVQIQAKQYAVEKGKTVFIYQDETGRWLFMEEEAALKEHIFPNGGIVSHMQ